jgi:hypothetical protein
LLAIGQEPVPGDWGNGLPGRVDRIGCRLSVSSSVTAYKRADHPIRVTRAAFACAILATCRPSMNPGTRGGSERLVNDMAIEDRQQLDEDMRAVSRRRRGPCLSARPGRPAGVRR